MGNNKELENYENIIQTLENYYDSAGDTKPEEKKAIRHILYTLSSLRDGTCNAYECNTDECLVSGVHACATC